MKNEKLCPYFGECGSCSDLDVPYEKQLNAKTEEVKAAFAQFGFDGVKPCKGLYYPYKFRNKITLSFEYKNGVKIGFFRTGTKQVVPIEACPLNGEWSGKLISVLHEFVKECKNPVYDVRKKTGVLRYVSARCFEDNLLVTVVTATPKVFGLDRLYKKLSQVFKTVSLWQNVNPSEYPNVFSKDFRHIAGEKFVGVSVCGVKVRLTPQCFFQTNLQIASNIYNYVSEKVRSLGYDKIIDLYSGVGITSVLFAKNGISPIGVEIEQRSVEEANRLAAENGVQIKNEVGDAAVLLPKIVSCGAKALFVDPPRDGLKGAALQILNAKPQTVIYLSCSLESLVSDLAVLQKEYEITEVAPFDMFPHTEHVETVVLMSRDKE